MGMNYYFSCFDCNEKILAAHASAGGLCVCYKKKSLTAFIEQHFTHDVRLMNEDEAEEISPFVIKKRPVNAF